MRRARHGPTLGAMGVWSLVADRWLPEDRADATVRWFNVIGPESPALDGLAERFGLHRLSIEDCRSQDYHAAKIDEFEDHLFVVLHAPVGESREHGPTEEIDAFLGRDFLITYQDRALPAVADLLESLRAARRLRPGVDGLLYELIDRAVDGGALLVDGMEERLDQLQEQMLREPGADATAEVLRLRAAVGRLRRTLAPQILVLGRLSRGESELIQPENHLYIRDVYDHVTRLDYALEGVREDADVLLNTQLSVINNRMNDVMKVLSVVSALALPAVVIAGIFGTNFDSVPGLHSNWGFATMLIAMGALAGGMAFYFRRRRWF